VVPLGKNNRLSAPLMYAFREAHIERDAKKKLDLRDPSGERVIAGRRATVRAAITEPKLRREVAQDLEILLNTINLESCVELEKFQHVRRSVLNFGLPDLTHRSIDEIAVGEVTKEIAQALSNFEPRLVQDTVQVSRDTSVRAEELKIRFVVRAELWCEPLNVPVEFVADIELDTGKILINRSSRL
jgi:type VI secretion system protein ImpF